MKRAGLLAVVLVALLIVTTAAAQTATPPRRPSADDVNRVAKKLYCPVCENEPLDVCQTPACVQWKAQIAQYLAEGRSEEEIIQEFVNDFGLRVQGEPPFSGTTAILWIGPILVAIAGAVYVTYLIRRMSKRGAATAPAQPAETPPTGDEYLDRIERDLKQQL